MSNKVASSQTVASHDNQTLSSSYSNSTLSHSHGSSYYHVKRNFVKNQRVKEEFHFAKLTQMIMISHCGLTTIPEESFQSIDEEAVRKLRRFDCSNNHITAIPPYILNTMQNLREIWINNNPINYFPQELLRLSSLEAIDISNTQISEIPLEIIELTQLIVFDWRKTPLAKNLLDQYSIQVNDLSTLKDVFMDLYRRKATKKILFDYLFGEFYVMDADKKYTAPTIAGFIEELCIVFEDLEDFESFGGRPGNFIAKTIDEIIKKSFVKCAQEARTKFYDMKRDTDRKRLAADVEIKLRGMYFDRIERSEVVGLIDSIYINVHSLEDMQFLVQYATKVLPPTVKEASGERIWQNILDLQDDLIHKREASMVALANALTQIYPEQIPESLLATSRDVARFFQIERFATEKELLRMTQLTADASKVFPPDYASVVPEEIIANAHEMIFKNLK